MPEIAMCHSQSLISRHNCPFFRQGLGAGVTSEDCLDPWGGGGGEWGDGVTFSRVLIVSKVLGQSGG